MTTPSSRRGFRGSSSSRGFSNGCRNSRGFSLVELLVAAVVMVLSSIGGGALFNSATRQVNTIHQSLTQQFSISNDLATVLELNDRYSCASGTCSASLGGDPPDQSSYVPDDPDDPAHSPTFRQLCGAGLANGLVNQVNATAVVAGPNVTRVASLEPAGSTSSATPHRYRVRWSSNGRTLRQVELIPTVAAWCP
jgi:prepilin-type N-terminal cleavage/methylation domain-containing protein